MIAYAYSCWIHRTVADPTLISEIRWHGPQKGIDQHLADQLGAQHEKQIQDTAFKQGTDLDRFVSGKFDTAFKQGIDQITCWQKLSTTLKKNFD